MRQRATILFWSLLFLHTSVWAEDNLSAEIHRSQRLTEIYAEASEFHFAQLKEFYLPQLSRSAWVLSAQRMSLLVGAFPPVLACGAASLVCAEIVAPVIFFGIGASGLTVTMAGLAAPVGTTYAGSEFLKEEGPHVEMAWPRDLLKQNLPADLLADFSNLNQDYSAQRFCDRGTADQKCSGLSLVETNEYLSDFDQLYGAVISQLRDRVQNDPTISLEVNSVWQYLNKPGRYQKYFKYMSLITYLEGLRYAFLGDLHKLRADLLAAQAD